MSDRDHIGLNLFKDRLLTEMDATLHTTAILDNALTLFELFTNSKAQQNLAGSLLPLLLLLLLLLLLAALRKRKF